MEVISNMRGLGDRNTYPSAVGAFRVFKNQYAVINNMSSESKSPVSLFSIPKLSTDLHTTK